MYPIAFIVRSSTLLNTTNNTRLPLIYFGVKIPQFHPSKCFCAKTYLLG